MDGLQAARHQWGPGKMHRIAPELSETGKEKTYCGLFVEATPGIRVPNCPDDKVTCIMCRNKPLREAETAVRIAKWQANAAERDAEWKRRRLFRREEYDAYMHSDEWRTKRSQVLERDNHKCQGCLKRRATQVHHLTYERFKGEMLFDLVALCDACHNIIHGQRDDEYTEKGDF